MTHSLQHLDWWSSLRHGGMLLDAPRLNALLEELSRLTTDKPLGGFEQDRLRRNLAAYVDDTEGQRTAFVKYMLESICGLDQSTGQWYRGSEVSPSWSQQSITGEAIRPAHLWLGKNDAVFPVFIDKEKRIGMGRGARMVSHALQWMRKTNNRLGLVTNGEQWRLLFAGLSYEAFAEWDYRQWLAAGQPTPELDGFRSLLSPQALTPKTTGESSLLVEAINDSRKGQADLSEILGERVRTAAELLIQGHTAALQSHFVDGNFTAQELYRAAVRIIMRLVVVLFAESRDALLPRDNPIYFNSYSLGGLREQLERIHVGRLRNSHAAYPRIISLFRLIYEGSSHESLTVRAYGGQLFEPGRPDASNGMSRAIHALEHGCYEHDVMNDQQVHQILDLLSRTKIRLRQGRQSTWVAAPVDFSSLDSEYIGILYEGLLDFELRQAGIGEPVIFLAVGNQPALPLATLEAMDDKSLKNLLESMKDTSSGSDDEEEGEGAEESEEQPSESEDTAPSDNDESATSELDTVDQTLSDNSTAAAVPADHDDRFTARTRAEDWARRAIEVGKLVTKPRGAMTDEKKQQYAAAIDRKARQIIIKVVLPGEWYLVRWGGTRKGSGTFYTRPQLAIPTVARTLQPLCYQEAGGIGDITGDSGWAELPADGSVSDIHGEYLERRSTSKRAHARSGEKDLNTGNPSLPTDHQPPATDWIPRPPEQILALKVCDPACGSGTFPLNALRYLTEALYESLHHYKRIQYYADRTVIDLIVDTSAKRTLAGELLPCRPEDNDFEARTKAVLRRYVVERCIYGVDYDPLAVELCRLSLWIETLDPRLPFTFLDHKIKAGNSLIGTWFDQFMHYPPMAWMREGGDKSHTNGVHFKKEEWTKAISAKIAALKNELIDYIEQQLYLNTGEDLNTIQTVHDEAEQALEKIHRIGIHEAALRSEEYAKLRASQSFLDAKFSLDLWCSIWFWPPEQIEHCPLVTEFYEGKLSSEAKEIVNRLELQLRFFHWQLEFPDVFNSHNDGFDAVLGNPPWDIAKPNSKEFFSALDPLYRSYGKQEAINKQKEYFAANAETERRWLDYNSVFRAQSNWVKNSGSVYGNAISTDAKGKQSQDLNIGGGGSSSFDRSLSRHEKWKDNREGMTGYSQLLEDIRGFHHQGGGDINLYKMFLEQAHAILRENGRMGFIVPSGIYSDHGTGALRTLFLEQCRWQWLFGFENRNGIFDIHRSFKFNPVIIQKGGQTDTIQTAFMRRDLTDWEHAEKFVTFYPRARVLQFSPRSKAILEIQSQRDLEVLEKIYSNSVLLGDDSPNGWGITYSREFDMTNDSKLFPPRDKWEERGYRPDEYSRWLKGNWQPRTADSPAPLNCKRVDIPAGIVLSRDGTSWISESGVVNDEFIVKKGETTTGAAIGIPLYQGAMLKQLIANCQRYISGAGNSVQWEQVDLSNEDGMFYGSQFLIPQSLAYTFAPSSKHARYLLRNIARTTDTRTIIGSPCPSFPAGHSLAAIGVSDDCQGIGVWQLGGVMSSLCFDWQFRQRLGGTNISFAFLAESAITSRFKSSGWVARYAMSLANVGIVNAIGWCSLYRSLSINNQAWKRQWALTYHERTRSQVVLDATVACQFGLDESELRHILSECDYGSDKYVTESCNSKGMWRVDKNSPPELRRTILTIVAFRDANERHKKFGNFEDGISDFMSQNDGEGWQLPETLRLADYGLGHDERAKEHQPVRECFGPRFYDWQLEQDPEESWRECHLHARNLLGPTAYQALLDELDGKPATVSKADQVSESTTSYQEPEDFTLSAQPAGKRKPKKG